MNPILVAGTGSWDGKNDSDWFCPGHKYGQFLAGQGITPTYDGDRPFVWSTNLSGVPGLTRSNHVDWQAGGAALSYFVIGRLAREGAKTALVVHSHGLQVALYAIVEHGLKVQTLISMGSPVRDDMAEIAKQARANIGYWLHVHSDGSDRWQWFGEMFDGGWKRWMPGGEPRIVREHPLADKNDFVPKVGHSELLRDPAQYHYWTERGWLDSLRG